MQFQISDARISNLRLSHYTAVKNNSSSSKERYLRPGSYQLENKLNQLTDRFIFKSQELYREEKSLEMELFRCVFIVSG